jgi:DNA-binding NarL/FixJ family response regulator
MRILIADDNQLVRRGIIGLIGKESGITVCGEAPDSAGAIQQAGELHPDTMLLDISMPGLNGLETARILKQKFPEIKILLISQHDPEQVRSRALEVGASGCVDKARLGTDLLPALKGLREQRISPAS